MLFQKLSSGNKGKIQARGRDGRTYTIGYVLGQAKPWVLEEDNNSRWKTLEDAENRAHEIDAFELGGGLA